MEIGQEHLPTISMEMTGTTEWAVSFLAAAEAAFNAGDVVASVAVYSRNARLNLITEGVEDFADGTCDIRAAWMAVFNAIPYFRLQKRLVAHSARTICNEWTGSIRKSGKGKAIGMEYWEFDETGKVIFHRLVTFLRVETPESRRAKFHFGIKFPFIGLRIERARKKLRNQLKSKEVSCHC